MTAPVESAVGAGCVRVAALDAVHRPLPDGRGSVLGDRAGAGLRRWAGGAMGRRDAAGPREAGWQPALQSVW
jgi:hypothetical protein